MRSPPSMTARRLTQPPRGPLDDAGAASAGLLAVLPGLLTGTELAGGRLIVASLSLPFLAAGRG